MVGLSDLVINVEAELSGFRSKMKEARASIKALANESVAMSKKVQQAFNRISQQQQPLIAQRLQRESAVMKQFAQGVIPTVNTQSQILSDTMSGMADDVIRNQQQQKQHFEALYGSQNKVTESLKAQKQQIKKNEQQFKQFTSKLQNAFLGIGLSILFTGMALKRLTDSALRAIITTMQQVTGDTHEFSVLTNRLTANWEFFKFTLMDALMQSGLFQWFIEKLISLISWFSDLSDGTKQFMVIMLVAGAVIGAVMMVLGQVILFLLAPLALVQASSIKTFADFKTAIKGAWMTMLKLIGTFAIIVVAFIVLRAIWESETTVINKIIYSTIVVLLALAGILAMFGAGALAVKLLVVAAFVAIIAIALAFKEELGMVFGFVIQGFLEVGDVIVETLLLPLRATLWAAGKLAEILGMEGAQRGIAKVSDAIQGVRDGIDSIKDKNLMRIDELNEERKNRASFMERTGLNSILDKGKDAVDDLKSMKPNLEGVEEATTNPGGNQTTNFNDQTFEFNINQQTGEDTDALVDRMMQEFNTEIERQIQSPQRG